MLSRHVPAASDDRPDCAAVDPENRLLWRINRRRLGPGGAPATRCCRVAGKLDLTLGGPAGRLVASRSTAAARSTAAVDRQNLPGLLRTFDFASPDAAQPAALHDDGAAAGVVPDEQPLRARASPAAREAARGGRATDPAVHSRRYINCHSAANRPRRRRRRAALSVRARKSIRSRLPTILLRPRGGTAMACSTEPRAA